MSLACLAVVFTLTRIQKHRVTIVTTLTHTCRLQATHILKGHASFWNVTPTNLKRVIWFVTKSTWNIFLNLSLTEPFFHNLHGFGWHLMDFSEKNLWIIFFLIFHVFFCFILYHPGFYSSLSNKKRRNGGISKISVISVKFA